VLLSELAAVEPRPDLEAEADQLASYRFAASEAFERRAILGILLKCVVETFERLQAGTA
jgi:hypothetical protein